MPSERRLKQDQCYRTLCYCEFRKLVGQILTITFLYLVTFLLGIDGPPNGPWFGLTVQWLAGLIGGSIAKLLKLPPLLGMLAAGVLLANAWYVFPIIPLHWSDVVRSTGLALILLRSGLDMNFEKIRGEGKVALRLTILPALVEGLVTAFVCIMISGMPLMLALAQGFILAAVSPAVVVEGMMSLAKRGYGVEKGIPSLVIAAASLDDIVAISFFSLFIGLAIQGEGTSIVRLAFDVPITLCIGVTVGFVSSVILSFNTIWDRRWKRSTALILLGFISMFGTKYCGYPGSGALGALLTAVLSSRWWSGEESLRLCNRNASKNNQSINKAAVIVQQTLEDLSFLWTSISEPLLFSGVGCTLQFLSMPIASIPMVLTVITVGSLVRFVVAYYATATDSFNRKERCFISLAWCPKATVQAALASVPLSLVNEMMPGQNNFEQYEEWSRRIQTACALSILCTAPLGSICIERYGKRWLERNDPSCTERNECRSIHSLLSEADELIQRDLPGEKGELSMAKVRKLLLQCKESIDTKASGCGLI